MPQAVVGSLTFDFPNGWVVSQYDAWAFYNNQVLRLRDGIKAIDLLAISTDRVAWLIEVKDYRRHQRTKPSCVSDEVAEKVFDSAAGLFGASRNATVAVEQSTAMSACVLSKIRVVLHLEQTQKPSKLFPRAIDRANVQLQLRRRVRAFDAHPMVVESTIMQSLPWKVF